MENIKIELKKSELKAWREFDLCQIQQVHKNLINCNVSKDEDKATFEFILDNARPLESIKEESLGNKYLFLINLKDLKELAENLSFDMNPINMYMDVNLTPKILMRDIYLEEHYNEEHFMQAYKAMIGTLLNEKYSFNDYFNGGKKLLLKSKITEPYIHLETIEDIYTTLVSEYYKWKSMVKQKRIEIDKSKYNHLIYFRRIVSIIVAALLVVSCYLGLFVVPDNKAVIAANESYVKQDYIQTMDSLNKIKLTSLSINSKYIYAVSYIKTDALSDEQKNNILASVTLNSNEKILNFWIELCRNRYDQAIDLAKQLGNKEYLLYGYMKQKTAVEKDGSLTGQERETKLKEIETNINELSETNAQNSNANSQGQNQ